MMKIQQAVKKINKFLQWEPHNIFHKTEYKWRKYDKPRMEGNFITGIYESSGDHYETYHYTEFGESVQRWPIMLEMLFKTFYYIISWPLYYCIKFPWILLCSIFIPQDWRI